VWEAIRKDPLIKTIVVILIGVLAFGFAFNIMFGAGGSAMEEGSMMSSGYSLSNTLENIIDLLIKVAIIGILLGIIVWIYRAITKQVSKEHANPFAWLKEDSIIRNALVITGSVIVLIFGFSFIRSIISSRNYNEMMDAGTNSAMTYTTFNITLLFAFLLKALIFVFLIILGYVILMYLKENYKNITTTKEADVSQVITNDCPECSAKVNKEWKCCPYCGSDKAFKNTTNQE
jgi:cbb3-type cytochrome oxidase subunit 3